MKYLKLLFVFSLLLLSTDSYAQSANSLYVDINNPNCSDSISKSNVTESNPWCSIGRAAWGSTERNSPNSSQAAGPGDTVIIKPGIYWTNGGNGRFDVALNPVNNGNANNPITFRGEGLVYVRMIQGPRGPMIGCNSRSYIIWDNFQIDDYYGGSTSDTGPIHFGGTHCQLLNSDIKGHPGSYYHGYATFGANYRGVSFEYGHFNIIKNNRIYNFTGGQNEAGIMMYNSDDNIIENNEIYNNGVGIFVKGYHNWNGTGPFQARNVIRNNLLYGNTHSSIRVLGANDTKVYQNVMYNCGVGLWAGFFNSTRSLFVNNTVSNCNVGILSQGNELEDVSFYNNVINSSSHAAIVTSNDISDQDVEYNRNIYFNNQRMLCNDWAGGCAAANLSQFQVLGKDPDSLEVNPLFVDANSRNFRLQASSPALALGRSILSIHGASGQTIPAGAYITGNEVIGLNTNGAPTPPPPPPSDTTPPTISSISVSNITTTGATVSWTTNESATSQLQYGPSTSYGSVTNSNGTTNHTVTLSNLTPNTTYNFRVSATDTSNNNSLSTNQTFTTAQVVTPPSTPASTVDLRANNSTSNITITAGNTFTLSWTSTNATGCTVTPGNFTGTNGTQTLSPTATTTYSASCTGTGGNSTDTITVNVSPQPTTPTPPTTPPQPTPTPPPPSTGSGGAPAPTTPTQPTPDPKPTTPTVSVPKPTSPEPTPKPTLTRTIYIGTKGSDVTELQNFLISLGYLQSGLNTGYYGNSTKEAVQKYQCNYMQLCSGEESTTGYGMVGQRTRASISSINISSTPTLPTTPTTPTSTLTPEQRAAIQKQINDLLLLVQQLLIQLRALQGN